MTVIIKWNGNISEISEDMVLGTRIISGKNQPFGAVEVIFDRFIFSQGEDDGKWDEENPKPEIVVGDSLMSVNTFGSVEDYVISSVSTDDDYTVVTAHHPAYNLTHTHFSSLFLNILTVEHDYGHYARFKVNLPGWMTGNMSTSDIPTDWYRATSGKGCQYDFSNDFTTSATPGSYYASPSEMMHLNRYTSGIGYYGGKAGFEDVAKKKYTFWYSYRDINLVFHISVETIGGEYIRSIEWIEGESEDVIRFVIMMGTKSEVYPQVFSPAMTYLPNPNTNNITDDPLLDYSEKNLKDAISKGLKPLNSTNDPYGTPIGMSGAYSTNRLRLRVNGTSTCKSLMDAISCLTNRKYHFSSEGFFMTNYVPDSSATKYYMDGNTFKSKQITINELECVYLDFNTNPENTYEGTEIPPEVVSNAPVIQDNTDAVVISAQTVYAENYGVKVIYTEARNTKEGNKILLPVADMSDGERSGLNRYRNRMATLCAYNELVNKYKYEDSIIYTTSEMGVTSRPSAKYTLTDYNQFEIDTGRKEGEPSREYELKDTLLYSDGLVTEKVELNEIEGELVWEEAELFKPSDEDLKYTSDSFTKLLVDNFNGFKINNVPLAFMIRTYPEHITTLAWGKSHTNDLPEQIRQQEEDMMISGAPEDQDLEISDKFSSKLVVGNLTQSQLAEQDDSKTGFTGLAMEKSVGSELYRLAGYKNGDLQAEFDTEGKISAGGGSVKLDEKGLTVYTDASGYKETDALTFKDRNGKDLSRIYSTITNGLRHTNIEAYDDVESATPGIISIYNKHITPEYAKENTKYTLTSTNTFSGVGGDDIYALYGTHYSRIPFGASGTGPITFNLRFNKSEGKFGGVDANVIDTLVLKIDSAGPSFNIPLNIYISYYINTTAYNSNNPLWTEQIALNELSVGKYPSIQLRSKNTAIEYIRIRITHNVTGGGNYLTMGPCYVTRRIVGGAIELDSEGVSISGNIRLNGSISGSASITGPIVDNIRNLTGNVGVVNYYTYYQVDAPFMFQKNTWIGVFDAGLGTGLTTGSAVLVSVVRDHQWIEIWVRSNPTSGSMRVAKSTDIKDGDGYSTHTFIVPYGGAFKCSERPTSISIAELVVK